jgi:hypothetical protein
MCDLSRLEKLFSCIMDSFYCSHALSRFLIVLSLACIALVSCGEAPKSDAQISVDQYKAPSIPQKSDMKVSYCGDNICDVEGGETLINCFGDCSVHSEGKRDNIKPDPGWIDPFPGGQ